MHKSSPELTHPSGKILFFIYFPLLRDNIFTPSHGSREKANKVIVVLTDGDIFRDPLNLTNVINSPKMQNVERFAIGVSARSLCGGALPDPVQQEWGGARLLTGASVSSLANLAVFTGTPHLLSSQFPHPTLPHPPQGHPTAGPFPSGGHRS